MERSLASPIAPILVRSTLELRSGPLGRLQSGSPPHHHHLPHHLEVSSFHFTPHRHLSSPFLSAQEEKGEIPHLPSASSLSSRCKWCNWTRWKNIFYIYNTLSFFSLDRLSGFPGLSVFLAKFHWRPPLQRWGERRMILVTFLFIYSILKGTKASVMCNLNVHAWKLQFVSLGIRVVVIHSFL